LYRLAGLAVENSRFRAGFAILPKKPRKGAESVCWGYSRLRGTLNMMLWQTYYKIYNMYLH